MPKRGCLWRHVVISTRCSWLPGDPRGFRNRRHRLHSSGDYKQPPPTAEHADLHRHMRECAADTALFSSALKPVIGQAIVRYCERKEIRLACLSVAPTHAHLLIELPEALPVAKRIIGRIKQTSSHVVRDALPGRIWADGSKFKPVHDEEYWKRVRYYIQHKQEPGAWVWSWGQTC